MDSFDISRLASEILLFIFVHLDLPQLVVCRRVNKQFQEVIDNNQLLWRVFEWIQQDQESFRPALDTFDQKSRSSIEKVTIQERVGTGEALFHLLQVLNQSKSSLKEIELKVANSWIFQEQVIELLTAGSKLRYLIVWDWSSKAKTNKFPLSSLVPSSSRVRPSTVDQLRLLWVYGGVAKEDGKHLNSIVSFAQGVPLKPQKCLEVISNFSETVVHLRLEVTSAFSPAFSPIVPLFCPNLKIFEGWVSDGVSSFLDAPQLQILILQSVLRSGLRGFPLSAEEIWLRSRGESLHLAEKWEPLLRLCPKLRILNLMEDFVAGFTFRGVLEMLRSRKQMAQDGKEIDGIKIVSLEKLILPTSMLNEKELKRAVEVAEEVIDVRDYPAFIEIEY